MATVTTPRLHHIALTVTDVDASVRWYESVFGVGRHTGAHLLFGQPHGEFGGSPSCRYATALAG